MIAELYLWAPTGWSQPTKLFSTQILEVSRCVKLKMHKTMYISDLPLTRIKGYWLVNNGLTVECDKALERNDFMDSIDSDKIKGSWSVQADESGSEVTIRSMVWPGYVGYHRANSCTFGGVYMGSGIKCHDLPFLLWCSKDFKFIY